MTGAGESLGFVAFSMVIYLLYQVQHLGAEVGRLSGQLDAVREKLGILEPLKVPPEVEGLLQAGRKIEAIKAYRKATGTGLAEAKTAVERIEARRGPAPSPIIQP